MDGQPSSVLIFKILELQALYNLLDDCSGGTLPAAIEEILSVAAEQPIVVRVTAQCIIAALSFEKIAAAERRKGVIAVAAPQRVVLPPGSLSRRPPH